MRWTVWLALSAAVIVLDQMSKQWVSQSLAFGEMRAVTPFFNLVLAHNAGAAFSFLAGAGGWQREFFMAIAGVASIVIIY